MSWKNLIVLHKPFKFSEKYFCNAFIFGLILIHSTPLEEVADVTLATEEKKEEVPLVLKGGKTITVNQFLFVGNKMVSTKQLQNLTRPYLYRALSQQDLEALQQRIIQYYQTKGDDNVKVMIPATQDPGTLKITVQESKGKK